MLLSPPSGESFRVSDQLDGSYRTEDLSAPYDPPSDREDELHEDDDSLPAFSHDSIAPVVEIQERSCQHPADETIETDADTSQTDRVTYTIVAESSQRGGNMIFSSIGYRYAENQTERGKVYWRCS
ncbi:Hypp2849 [Branchiostoma lanceolatum]|uniref:Hypp2849 protein n=1 Tax=Branchiostoma lanceolatum TaxID=7740 RepID=A0A8K0ES64_BRALA|nr:Hypp2849 [Branchiostoma lanceolatum]